MSIQRQYSLPNCSLVLEGWGDTVVTNQSEARPLMSQLMSVECHLVGEEKPLSGGREFLESLTTAVSLYAQELLSGIRTFKKGSQTPTQLVQLERLGHHYHRLSVLPPDADPGSGIATHLTRQVDLTTVQLFDLVEAIDQFFADTQTLPDLALHVVPLAKRSVRSSEPVAQQAVPAAIGASGLALAALAFFFIPTPQVRQPEDLVPKASTTSSTTGTPSPSTSPPTPIASGSPKPSPTSTPTTTPSPTPTTTQPDLTQLEATLTAAPEITDSAQIQTLQKQLATQLDQAWKNRTALKQDLVYRVGVVKDGAIVGYKPITPGTPADAQQTPLPNLLYIPSNGSQSTKEPIAQYKVVFTSRGVVDVAPWKSTIASPLTGITEITDAAQITALQPKLYDQIDKNWQSKPSFKKDLVFRVRVTQDGTIVDYKPNTQPAADYDKETPLPQLGKLAADGDAGTAQVPLALFKVVFKPDGKLEVSPWRGRRDSQ
ncbi:DUF4335 domain-containing protein [Stenomitos frigidus]|uniref:DUF4335 domain-containing protein n=1 Tax=Stenomitos frigidus ULC18 TaxID=2107698 RepID=A0A2T1E5J9_9CYAN|nr:DUF4335 domain-containing protein [Stenomitos frigidus]PSB28022.1 hypothetical protein C7B82_14285 [Stenomitos frigidus ULC18]